jgi:hypothetical protein
VVKTDSSRPTLSEHISLRRLRDQAKDLLHGGQAKSLTHAQFKLARSNGCASWPQLREHAELLQQTGELKRAIDASDASQVVRLMTVNPELHRAPLGYAANGPLTWVAECRVPWEAPTPARLAIAKWMIENGSDVHQGGDGPLMRAALNGSRIAMMELLVSCGADVNALWNGDFPIIFAPCEAVNPVSLKWLLEHGGEPNCPNLKSGTTALDYLIGTYARSRDFRECLELLIGAGGITRYNVPCFLDLLRGRFGRVAQKLGAEPLLIHHRFPELECGSTGGRRLLLQGATLLHAASEFGDVEAARFLLDRGADVNVRAAVSSAGVVGQTPIFHAVSQFRDWGLAVARLLLERGADLSICARLPGDYERPGEFVNCTPLGYALRFPGAIGETVRLLRQHGGTA